MLTLGYVRVSSIEQEQGFGPEVQEAAIRAYCREHALGDPEIAHESASAESIVQRVEIKALLHRAKQAQDGGTPAHVVFYRLDRLARNLLDQESVVGLSLKHGFRLHSTFSAEAEPLDPAYAGDPMRVAIRQFFGIFSQLERATIQGRLDAGLAAKAKQGGSTGGKPPFGYWCVNQDVAIDPEAAEIVRLVYQLHQRGFDQRSIAAQCARQCPQRCASWGNTQVSRILKRKALYGQGHYKSRMGEAVVVRPELCILTASKVAS
jgi:site-specific DNA recombinase